MRYSIFLKEMDSCPFCNLDKKEIIKQNKSARVILAKAPYHKDHLLVVPKRHVLTISELKNSEWEDITKLVFWAGKKLEKKHHNLSILYREGKKKEVGKSIDHFHVNLIPDEKIGSIKVNQKDREFLSEKKYMKRTKEFKDNVQKKKI